MKNKFKYILPRLIGLTVILGALSFLIVALFKIMILITVVTAVGMWIAARRFKKRIRQQEMAVPHFRNAGFFANENMIAVVPVSFKSQSAKAAIIPVR